jgi:hypothetical protein
MKINGLMCFLTDFIVGLHVAILYGTLWSMMAKNTIISTPAWSVVAAAPSATPSAVHRRRVDLKLCLFLLFCLQGLNTLRTKTSKAILKI